MATTGYRIHDMRHLDAMLDPETQISLGVNHDEVCRQGVSYCRNIPELGAYFAVMPLDITNPGLVKVTGEESDDNPCDANLGEHLMFPTSYQVIDGVDFYEMIDPLLEMALEGADYDEVLDAAYDLFETTTF